MRPCGATCTSSNQFWFLARQGKAERQGEEREREREERERKPRMCLDAEIPATLFLREGSTVTRTLREHSQDLQSDDLEEVHSSLFLISISLTPEPPGTY